MAISYVTANRTVIGTAFADVTDLAAFSMAASTNYYFRFVIHYTTDATTTGAIFAVNGPTTPTALRVGGHVVTGASAANYGSQTAYDTAIFATTAGPGATARVAIIEGILRNAGNTGTFALRFAAEVVSPGSVTVLPGSIGIVTVIDANIARVTADRAVTTTAFADVTDLSFSVAADTNYYFRFILCVTTNATTTGARFGINGPASPTALRIGGQMPTGTAAINFGSQTAYDTAIFAATTGPGATAIMTIIEGVFRNAGTSGTLQLRFASELGTGGAQVDVLTDSYGFLAVI